jgi:hypothetical protein
LPLTDTDVSRFSVEEKSMARIIPGVQVTVVKEVVPPQLAPSGVLGLIGITESEVPADSNSKTVRASSWSRFVEVCGAASAYSLPEAAKRWPTASSSWSSCR